MNTGDDRRLVDELAEAVSNFRPVVLATVVATKRSVPRRAGTKMLIYADGSTSGTVGGGAMEARVVETASQALAAGKTQLLKYELLEPSRGDPGVCGGEVQIYLEPYMSPHTVFVIGAGHVGRTVVDLAHWLGYRTVISDDREGLATEENIPLADVRLSCSVKEALEKEPITTDTSVVLVSRDIDIDVDAVPRLVDSPAGYVGVMGSQRRWKTVRKQLLAKGIDNDELSELHVPIGIELGAETLEEIAVSILAEVIKSTRVAEPDSTQED